MFFSFQLTKSFCSRSQKFLDVGAGSRVKNVTCLEPEPEIWVPASPPCFRLMQSTIRKMHLLRSLTLAKFLRILSYLREFRI